MVSDLKIYSLGYSTWNCYSMGNFSLIGSSLKEGKIVRDGNRMLVNL